MDYGRLISRAFEITKRHRFLWWLGILAGFTEMGGGFNFPNPGDFGKDWPKPTHQHGQFSQLFQHFHLSLSSPFGSQFPSRFNDFNLMGIGIGLIIILALLTLVIGLGVVVISTMARGGLIASVAGIERQEPVSFKRGFGAGYHAFWRIFAIGLLIGLAALGVLALLAVPAIILAITEHYIGAIILGILGFLIFLPIVLYLGLLVNYALRIVVIENGGVQASLSGAHQIIRRNLGPVLLVWLLALAFGIGYAVALTIALLVVLIPLALLGWAIYSGLGLVVTIIYGVIFGLLVLAGILFVQGLMATFISSYWTLAYLALTKPKEQIVEVPLPAPAA
jgi:hypothetical protein